MLELINDGQQPSIIKILHEEHGIDIAPCENLELHDSSKYIVLKNYATELSLLIGEIPNLSAAIANYKALGQTAYSITINDQSVLPSQLFQKSNGAFVSNLRSDSGVGFGKQTDVLPIDFAKMQAANIANAAFGIASVATATYYLKSIDDKLLTIQEDTNTIIRSLETAKQAQIQNDFIILQKISDELEEIKKNETTRRLKLDTVSDIARTQGEIIQSYEINWKSLLQSYKASKGKKQKSKVANLGRDYQYYRLSIQIYALSQVIEMELANWYDITHLKILREDFEKKINQFMSIHDILLEATFTVKKQQRRTQILYDQSKIYHKIGNSLKDTPAASIGLDSRFCSLAAKKKEKASQRALADSFAVLGEKRIGQKNFEKVHSIEKPQSIEPLLEVISSMETAYSSPMKMIVCGEDVYLEIKNKDLAPPEEHD